jgi:hypothetical protein
MLALTLPMAMSTSNAFAIQTANIGGPIEEGSAAVLKSSFQNGFRQADHFTWIYGP